jgi:hypothetical protein
MLAEILALIRPWNLGGTRELHTHRADSVDAHRENAVLELVSQEDFRKVLSIEEKRADRSERRFVLMLVHVREILQTAGEQAIQEIAEALSTSTRETDFCGWYNQGSVVGVICTEIGTGEVSSVLGALHSKVTGALRKRLQPTLMKAIPVSLHVFPNGTELKQEIASADASASSDLQPVWVPNSPGYASANPSAS